MENVLLLFIQSENNYILHIIQMLIKVYLCNYSSRSVWFALLCAAVLTTAVQKYINTKLLILPTTPSRTHRCAHTHTKLPADQCD